MAKRNSSNQDFTNNSDGFDLSGGTTARKLTLSGGDIALTGSGGNTYTFPSATDTLVGRASTDTLTNKTLTSPVLTTPNLGTPSAATLTNATGLPLTGLVNDITTALGVGSINLGHASDTTITRTGAGDIAVEGNGIYRAGGTDVAVADGGTGSSSAAAAALALAVQPSDGWVDANETWTYASGATTNVGTFTITGDKSAKYEAGQKVKFTQTTVKYAVITKVAVSTDTTITIYMGTDYTIANAAISANYYSIARKPFGFPVDPDKWVERTTSTSDRTISTTSYGSLTDTLVVPIGLWRIRFKACFGKPGVASTTNDQYKVTLSTDASTETNPQLTVQTNFRFGSAGATSAGNATCHSEDYVNLASSTTFTMMGLKNSGADNGTVGGSSYVPTVIEAFCEYI